jgi:hypothetical protein
VWQPLHLRGGAVSLVDFVKIRSAFGLRSIFNASCSICLIRSLVKSYSVATSCSVIGSLPRNPKRHITMCCCITLSRSSDPSRLISVNFLIFGIYC